jgi:type II secretory pathway pseudopilin PulG
MRSRRIRGFALVELAMTVAVMALLSLLMLPVMKQRWNADGQSISINNVRQLVAASAQYRLDHVERTPMRGGSYNNGNLMGWDTWNFAGKNASTFWQGGQFDEHAHWRFLNPYIQGVPAPVPTGFVNTGSGATWTFQQGTLTAAQRAGFGVKVCRSPGDVGTRQRNWPNQTPGVSSYDDVGTSYHQNMKWWDQPGAPSGFTQRFNAGSEGMRTLPGSHWYRSPSNFVWIHDQTADVAANNHAVTGEFGGENMSVAGFLDGRAGYIQIALGTASGPGYTLAVPWP